MLRGIERTIVQDVHASKSSTVSSNSLSLTMLTDVTYFYYVNANHQMIRIQDSGGVAVIGAHVASLTATKKGALISVTVELTDGNRGDFDVWTQSS
jgi:hypothetical protein